MTEAREGGKQLLTTIDNPGSHWPKVAVHSGAVTTRGERIRRARDQRGMTQQELAQATGIGMRTIGRIEAGEVAENSRSMARLEAYLGLNTGAEQKTAGPAGVPDLDNPRIKQAGVMELLAELALRFAQLDRAAGRNRSAPAAPSARWETKDAPSATRQPEEPDHGQASM